MKFTFTLNEIGLFLIIIAVLVLLVYVIIMVKNVIPIIKNGQKVAEDSEIITRIARERVEDVDALLDGVTDSVGNITEALKGKESLIQSLSSVAKAVTSMINLLKEKK